MFVLNIIISLSRVKKVNNKTKSLIMSKQTATASQVVAKARHLTRGNIFFNSKAVAAQDVVTNENETKERTVVTVVTGLDQPVVQFIARVTKSLDGVTSFTFETMGTDDVNVFLEALS